MSAQLVLCRHKIIVRAYEALERQFCQIYRYSDHTIASRHTTLRPQPSRKDSLSSLFALSMRLLE